MALLIDSPACGHCTQAERSTMIDCVMCITNEGTFKRFYLGNGHWCTIDNITLKMRSGRRLKRYAVCLDGHWCSDQYMNLKEARVKVGQLKEDFSMKPFKPLTIDQMREFAKQKGAEQAYNILLLGGYGFIEGTCKDYNDLLKEFERGFTHGAEDNKDC